MTVNQSVATRLTRAGRFVGLLLVAASRPASSPDPANLPGFCSCRYTARIVAGLTGIVRLLLVPLLGPHRYRTTPIARFLLAPLAARIVTGLGCVSCA